MKQKSPFVFRDYVSGEKFFNRWREIEFFRKSISVDRKILLCIVAPLKYGKTSLMLKYMEILEDMEDIISIYVNLKVVRKPIRYIVGELSKFGLNLKKQYEDALRGEELFKLFDKLNNFLVKNNKWLFLLFDEFHLLPELIRNEGFFKNLSDNHILAFMRGVAEGKRISYIVCGSVIEPLMDALDVWGGRFEIIYLGPFKKDDAVYMIKKLFREGGMEISDEYAEIIADAAGFHPFYIQYMGHHIYMSGKISRSSIMEAKSELYNFLRPIFSVYFERILSLENRPIETIRKLVGGEKFEARDLIILNKLLRMGILKIGKHGRYEFVDPLFKRYIETIINGYEPTGPVVVGHWAERIVGNYLMRKGYTPFFAYDSKGAFDIYVKIKDNDIGIQVKFSSSGVVNLSEDEFERIIRESKELKWIPILALVSKRVTFFRISRAGKYEEKDGSDIDNIVA